MCCFGRKRLGSDITRLIECSASASHSFHLQLEPLGRRTHSLASSLAGTKTEGDARQLTREARSFIISFGVNISTRVVVVALDSPPADLSKIRALSPNQLARKRYDSLACSKCKLVQLLEPLPFDPITRLRHTCTCRVDQSFR